MRLLLARLLAFVLLVAESIRYRVPAFPWRVWRARRHVYRLALLVFPGDHRTAAQAAKAAGDRLFVEEFLPAVAARKERGAAGPQKSLSREHHNSPRGDCSHVGAAMDTRVSAGCAGGADDPRERRRRKQELEKCTKKLAVKKSAESKTA